MSEARVVDSGSKTFSGSPGRAEAKRRKQTGSSGGSPRSTGGAQGSPGGAPGSPGGAPGSPGGTPGSPGGAPGSPGGAPGSPGGTPGSPGWAPGSPGGAPGSPGRAEDNSGPPGDNPGGRGNAASANVPGGAPAPRPSNDDRAIPSNDSLNAEFSYYCAVLRTYAPSLSREYDKVTTRQWMRKLFGPEYHPTVLKPKRNKYLLYLSTTVYNDEAYGIFRQEPPCGKLPEIRDIFFDRDGFPPAAWESEKQWNETLNELPNELKILECYIHAEVGCPDHDYDLAGALDDEFQFFLWLSKPYVALLPDPEEKTTAACWIRQLCGIAPEKENCVTLKEIRNEYMQALLGYVHDLRVEGPFRMMPPVGPVPPLGVLYDAAQEDFADPAGGEAEEFLALQRLPESGAFAYINVTGELFENL